MAYCFDEMKGIERVNNPLLKMALNNNTITQISTQELEYKLFTEYKKTKSKELRDQLVENYLYIARILSKKFVNRGIDYEDLLQVAYLGIIYAVERFNPDRGVRFATFATPTVMGEIRKYFRDKGNFIQIPRSLYEIFYKAEKIKREAYTDNISNEELSRILNIPKKDIEEAYKIGDTAFIRSLELEAYADGAMTLSNVLGREDSDFLMIEDKDFIKTSLEKLSHKEVEFINLRYCKEYTQKDIAVKWDMSQMQVSRFERRLLKKLRDFYFHD